MSEKLDKVKDLQAHTKLPCEKETHCLMFIPLHLGMKIMGAVSIISGVLNVLAVLKALSAGVIYGVIAIIFCLAGLYSAFLWFNWFKKDDKETTGKLV